MQVGETVGKFEVLKTYIKEHNHKKRGVAYVAKIPWLTVKCNNCEHIKEAKASRLSRGEVTCKTGKCAVNFVDLKGQTFGNLNVLDYEKVPNPSGKVRKTWRWRCKCSCGNEELIHGGSLKHQDKIACTKCSRARAAKKLSKDPQEVKANRLYRQYKRNAAIRDYSFSISNNLFKQIIKENCYYCGKKPQANANGLICTGMDRVDNTKGYTEDNIKSCCKVCNIMKNNMQKAEFIEHIQLIISNQTKRSKTSA